MATESKDMAKVALQHTCLQGDVTTHILLHDTSVSGAG